MLALTKKLGEIVVAPARDLEQPHQPSTQLPPIAVSPAAPRHPLVRCDTVCL
jgi:hypothetical protein